KRRGRRPGRVVGGRGRGGRGGDRIEARPGRWIDGKFFGGPAGRWPGATVVVAASGPSLTKEDLEFVRGKAKLIVVNATFKLAPWADLLYAADFRFWEVYAPKIFPTFQGEMWSVSEMARDRFGTYWIRCGTGQGFSREPDTINGGGNSGYQAIHLAATFGAKKIVLLGFDMQRTGGLEHWHGKHEGNLPNGRGFASWMQQMTPLARDLEAMGVEV